jgi:hypothetical protein
MTTTTTMTPHQPLIPPNTGTLGLRCQFVTEVSRRCTSYALTQGRKITRYKKAIAVIAIGAMIASVFYEGILFVSFLANDDDDGTKQLKKQVSSVCGECKFQFHNTVNL